MKTQRYWVRLLRDERELMSFRPQWTELAESSSITNPYSDFDWYNLNRQHFERDDEIRVGILQDADGVLAIVPLRLTRSVVGPLRVRVLREAGGGWAPQNTCVLADRAADVPVLHAILREFSRLERWVYCLFTRIPQGSPLLILEHDKRRDTPNVRAMGSTVLIRLPDKWEDYRASLSPAHRKTISRRVNGLERIDVTNMVRVGPGDVFREDLLKTLMTDALVVSRHSWQSSAESGRSISDDDTTAFFLQSSEQMARKGMLDLSVLYLGRRPISFIWGLGRGTSTSICKLAFDAEFGDFSPGLVHLAKYMVNSIDRKLTDIDFGHEFADYKSKWSKHSLPIHEVRFYGSGLLGSALRWKHQRKAPKIPVDGGQTTTSVNAETSAWAQRSCF